MLNFLGKLDEAISSYHKALAIEPDHAVAWNNLKFATKAFIFSNTGGDQTRKAGVNGLNDSALATAHFAILQFYLDGFRPHEADLSFEQVIAALPAMVEETIPIDEIGRASCRERV